MTQTQPPRRLPWVAGSIVTAAAFVAIYVIEWYDVLPNTSPATVSALGVIYSIVPSIALVSVALPVGYLFRQRFEYPLRGIFLTCASTSFLVIMALESVTMVPEISETRVISNAALFLFGVFASSAFGGIVTAFLIAAGAVLNRRATAKGQILPVNP